MSKEKRKLATADCETDPFKEGRLKIEPFIWGLKIQGEEFIYFDSTIEFVNYIKDHNILCYVHNGGKFDFHFLIEYVAKLEPLLMINSRLVKGRIGKCEIRDSYAILPLPLRDFKKDDFDYNLLEKKNRDIPENRAKIIEYLKNDCEYLLELVEAFVNEYGRQITIASAAIKKLQKIENIKIENSGEKFFDDFSHFYFGGRVEAIEPGEYHGEILFLDINSAYPFAMKHAHPIGTNYFTSTNKSPVIKPHGFYKIKAKSFGAFCRREKFNLTFDNDGIEREYFTTGHELLAALETKSAIVTEHLIQYVFQETKDFSNYVSHFWNLRKTTAKGSPENIFAKLFLNSAYGKFCSNPKKYSNFMLAGADIGDFMLGLDYKVSATYDDTILFEKDLENDEMRFFNVATGASITGFVRAMLLRAIKSVGTPLYCDTDSLIFMGSHSIPLNDELGNWKIEGEFKQALIAGKKLYGLEYKTPFKDKKTDKMVYYKTAAKGGKLEFNELKLLLKGHSIEKTPINPVFSFKKAPHFLKKTFKMTAKRA